MKLEKRVRASDLGEGGIDLKVELGHALPLRRLLDCRQLLIEPMRPRLLRANNIECNANDSEWE